jgi:hypothetical protein
VASSSRSSKSSSSTLGAAMGGANISIGAHDGSLLCRAFLYCIEFELWFILCFLPFDFALHCHSCYIFIHFLLSVVGALCSFSFPMRSNG